MLQLQLERAVLAGDVGSLTRLLRADPAGDRSQYLCLFRLASDKCHEQCMIAIVDLIIDLGRLWYFTDEWFRVVVYGGNLPVIMRILLNNKIRPMILTSSCVLIASTVPDGAVLEQVLACDLLCHQIQTNKYVCRRIWDNVAAFENVRVLCIVAQRLRQGPFPDTLVYLTRAYFYDSRDWGPLYDTALEPSTQKAKSRLASTLQVARCLGHTILWADVVKDVWFAKAADREAFYQLWDKVHGWSSLRKHWMGAVAHCSKNGK